MPFSEILGNIPEESKSKFDVVMSTLCALLDLISDSKNRITIENIKENLKKLKHE